MEASIRGADDLERVARRLKETGNGELRKALLKGIRDTVKPTTATIRAEAYRTLPRRGGLAERVAKSRFGARTRTSGQNVGVRIEGRGAGGMDLRFINQGRLRHPVYGNRRNWVQQQVSTGFFDEPIERDKPAMQRSIQRVMDDVARHIERTV